jgi:hypothetical protein
MNVNMHLCDLDFLDIVDSNIVVNHRTKNQSLLMFFGNMMT